MTFVSLNPSTPQTFKPVVINTQPVIVPADFIGINSNQNPGGTGPSAAAPLFDVGAYRTNDYLIGGWRGFNPSSGVFDWTFFDLITNLGKTVTLTFCGTPVWALLTPGDSSFNGPDGNPGSGGMPTLASVAAAITAVTTRKKGLRIEISNEPRYDVGHTGFSWYSAAQHVDQVATAYAAAKAVDPTCKIIPGGFIYTPAISQFLNALGPTTGKYGREVIDGLAVHSYYDLPTYQSSLNAGSPQSARVGDAWAALAAAGIPNLPVYVNEYGTGVSPTDNALLSFLALAPIERRKWIRRRLVLYAGMGVQCVHLYAYGPASVNLCGDLVTDIDGSIAGINDANTVAPGKTIAAGMTQDPDGTVRGVSNGVPFIL